MRRTKYTEVSSGEIDQMKRALEKCKVNPAKRYELEVTDQEMSFQGQPVTSLSLLDMSTPKGAPIVSGLKSLKELDSAIPPPNTPTVPPTQCDGPHCGTILFCTFGVKEKERKRNESIKRPFQPATFHICFCFEVFRLLCFWFWLFF